MRFCPVGTKRVEFTSVKIQTWIVKPASCGGTVYLHVSRCTSSWVSHSRNSLFRRHPWQGLEDGYWQWTRFNLWTVQSVGTNRERETRSNQTSKSIARWMSMASMLVHSRRKMLVVHIQHRRNHEHPPPRRTPLRRRVPTLNWFSWTYRERFLNWDFSNTMDPIMVSCLSSSVQDISYRSIKNESPSSAWEAHNDRLEKKNVWVLSLGRPDTRVGKFSE